MVMMRRFFPFLQQALWEFGNMTLSGQSADKHCHYSYSVSPPPVSGRHIDITSFKLSITNNGIHVDAVADLLFEDIVASGSYFFDPLDICYKVFSCHTNDVVVTVNGVTISMDFIIASQNPFVIEGTDVQLGNFNPTVAMAGCSGSDLTKLIVFIAEFFGDNIVKNLENTILKYVTNAVESYTQLFNVPQTYSTYTGIYITYSIASVVFVPDTSVCFHLTAVVTATNSQGVNVTYIDPSACDASTYPPDDWNYAPGNEYLLTGLRISNALMTASLWAGNVVGAFAYTNVFGFLDAVLYSTGYYQEPATYINGVNNVSVHIASGMIFVTCSENATQTGTPGTNNTVLDFSFKNLDGSCTSAWANKPEEGLTLQISAFDLADVIVNIMFPLIPLPTTVLLQLFRSSINGLLPVINQYFQSNPLLLPSNVLPFLVNPTSDIYPQDQDSCPGHGYLDLASFCNCSVPDPSQSRFQCKFQCTAEKLAQPEQQLQSVAASLHRRSDVDVEPDVFYLALYDNANKDCFNNNTDAITMVYPLLVSNASCLQLHLASGLFYYKIDEKTNLFSFLCIDDTCDTCVMANGTIPDYDQCIISTSPSMVYARLPQAPDGTLACFGGCDSAVSGPSNVALVTYYGALGCNMSTSPSQTHQVLVFETDACATYSDDTMFYVQQTKAGSFDVFFDCSDGCDDLANCSMIINNVTMGACFQMESSGLYASLVYPSQALEACWWSPSPAPDYVIFSIALVFGIAGAFFATAFIVKYKTDVAFQSFVQHGFSCLAKALAFPYSCIASAIELMRDPCSRFISHCSKSPRIPSFGQDIKPAYNKLEFFLVLGAAAFCGLMRLAFEVFNPFRAFGSSGLESLGLDSSNTAINFSQLVSFEQHWTSSCKHAWEAAAALAFLVAVVPAFFNWRGVELDERLLLSWLKAFRFSRIIALLAIIMMSVLMLVLPLLFVSIRSMIYVNSSSNVTASPSSFVQDESFVLGGATTGLILTYICPMFMFSIHAIVPAVLFVKSCLMTLDHQQLIGWTSFAHVCDVYHRMSLACRIPAILLAVTSFFAAVCLYQLGQPLDWAMLLAVSWVLPYVQISINAILCRRHMIKLKRHEAQSPRFKLYIWLSYGIFLLAHAYCTMVAMSQQSNLSDSVFGFGLVQLMSSFYLVAIAAFLALLQSITTTADRTVRAATTPKQEKRDYLKPKHNHCDNNDTTETSALLGETSFGHGVRWDVYVPSESDLIRKQYQHLRKVGKRSWLLAPWHFLWESDYAKDYRKYGLRASWRRFFLVVACTALPLLSYLQYQTYSSESALAEFQQFVNQFANVTWPDSNNGTVILNGAIDLYGSFRWVQYYIESAAIALMISALLVDIVFRSRRGLRYSQTLTSLAGVAFYTSVLLPVLGSYLSASQILTILPDCAPQFNRAVLLMVENTVAEICIAFVASKLLPILLFVVLELVRVAWVVVMRNIPGDETGHQDLTDYYGDAIDHTLLNNTMQLLVTSCLFFGPIITVFPLVVIEQLFPAWYVGALSLAIWTVPIAMWFSIPARMPVTRYISFAVTQLGLIAALFVCITVGNGWMEYITELLQSRETWLGLVGELSLTIVLLSDAIISHFDALHLF